MVRKLQRDLGRFRDNKKAQPIEGLSLNVLISLCLRGGTRGRT